jgi:hypothetical protein
MATVPVAAVFGCALLLPPQAAAAKGTIAAVPSATSDQALTLRFSFIGKPPRAPSAANAVMRSADDILPSTSRRDRDSLSARGHETCAERY